MSELNPNHPVTQSLHDQWHTLAAVLVAKSGGHAVISLSDLQSVKPGSAVVVQELEDGIHLRVVDAATAAKLAKKEGGLLT